MRYRFYTCDVFTDTRFGGNQLAVLPDAAGLTDQQMQQIAREFNYSESTFVFPPEAGHTRKVRIFTPAAEMPFAGHPNVGTAFVLASTGALGQLRPTQSVTFEEKAGLVPITIEATGGQVTACEIAAPAPLSLGRMLPAAVVASAVSLAGADIVTTTHEPQVASVGLPFLFAEVRDRQTLARSRINMPGFEAILAQDVQPFIYLYTRATDGFDLRARMFAPTTGVPEDPATGSATCAVAGLMAHLDARRSGSFRWRVAQGVEMGRPSTLLARAEKKDGVVQGTWVGGACVMVAEGVLQLD